MDAKPRIVQCLTDAIPFMAYSLPGTRELSLIEESDPLASGVCIRFFGKDSRSVSLSHSVKRSRLIENPVPTDFSEYAKGFNHIVDSLKTAGGKTVLSRVIRLEAEQGVDWTRIIDNLFDRADINTFRFVYYTLETGVWLGASPELLLKEDASGMVSTMALAGTRPVGVSDWDDKK